MLAWGDEMVVTQGQARHRLVVLSTSQGCSREMRKGSRLMFSYDLPALGLSIPLNKVVSFRWFADHREITYMDKGKRVTIQTPDRLTHCQSCGQVKVAS